MLGPLADKRGLMRYTEIVAVEEPIDRT